MSSRIDDHSARPTSWKALRRLILRYALGVVMVAVAFGLRKLLQPLTGTGAPYVLFFGAVMATSLWVGPGPGVLATLLSLPLGTYVFVVRAGFAESQAATQAALFAVDGLVVVYLSSLVTRARRVAETSEERLRLANEAASIASWELDVPTGLLRWSRGSGLMLGLPEDASPRFAQLLAHIHPDDREAFERAYGRSLDPAGDGTLRCEVRVAHPDGSVRWLSWAGRTYRDDRIGNSASPRQIGTAIDVTERRQREDALKQLSEELSRSEARHRDLIELAPDAFFLADLDGRFKDVNQTACRLLGYERDELIGKTIADIIPPEDAPRLAGVRAALLVPGQVERSEWRLRRRDGALVPVEVSSNILPGGLWQAFVRDISERKRIEDERQVFVSLLDNSSDFIGIADPNGKPVYLNPAGRRMVGLPADYPVEKTQIPEYYAPEERAFATDVIVRSMTERGRWSGETYFRHWQTQEAIPVSDDHFMILDPGGQRVLGMGTVTRDISEARRTAHERERLLAREQLARQQAESANVELRESEERLRLSEARFSGIISISADAIISIDEQQRITLFNDGAQRIFGYTRGDAIGAPLEMLIPERFRAVHRRHVAAFAAGTSTSRRMGEQLVTVMGRRKSGEEFPADAAISKLEMGDRTILTVALRDVTERKRVEQEQRFLAEAGAVLASSLDYEQTMSTVGRLVVRQFADWCIVDLVESDKRPWRRRVISARGSQDSLAAQLEQLRLDRRLPHLAGPVLDTRRPLLVERMTPEKLESFAQSEEHLRILRAIDPQSILGLPLLVRGQLLGVLVLISTSPAHTYRPEDLRMAEALAERAGLAIENGRLYQIAVDATRFRDEVLGVVAHDLRNPVAAIAMLAAALRKDPEHERRNPKPIESILRATGRMTRLIGDLVDATLIEAGQLGIEHARVSTRQLLTDSVEAQRPLATSASLEMQLELADDLPDVWGDQHRLLQVLENLIGNGIKFTPVQGRITVGAAPRAGEVLFWVADTGCGIAPDGLPHVFDRFWQARKGAHHGAGLGLPITRGIIEAHGGRIWVESTLGRRTVFFFTVPEAPRAEAPRVETMH